MTETDIKPRVLFLCTHNAARSQMAEAFLRHYAGDRFEVLSAGLAPTQVHPLTREVLTETDLDPSGLRAKGINDFLGGVSIHYAIIVCDQAEEHCPRLYPFALQTLYWPFDDPTQAAGSREECLRTFRNVRDQIAHRVRAWLDTLEESD
jgi:arsenate reductase